MSWMSPQLEVNAGQPGPAGRESEGLSPAALAPLAASQGGDLPLLPGNGSGGLVGF